MRFLRKADAAAKVGFHPRHLMRLARDPKCDFPAPVKISSNAVGFVESELEDWMKRRLAERDLNADDNAAGYDETTDHGEPSSRAMEDGSRSDRD